MHTVNFFCPVCGYKLDTLPINHTICPSCGTEFGYHDRGRSYEELRSSWIERGAHWWSPVDPLPTNWNWSTQLLRAGLQVERPLTARLAPSSQVASFAASVSQPLEGRFDVHISPFTSGGLSSARGVLVHRKGRKLARSVRRSIPGRFGSQIGICALQMSGSQFQPT